MSKRKATVRGDQIEDPAAVFLRLINSVVAHAEENEIDFLPFRFHHLRHRHAVDWLQAGKSIYDVQQRLGHTSVKTTEIYLKYLTADPRKHPRGPA